jgi:hypothetical protein
VPRVRGIAAGWWQQLGRVSAPAAVLALYGGVALVLLAVPDGEGQQSLALTLLGIYVAYCIARPRDRMDAFSAAIIPGPILWLPGLVGIDDPAWWIKGLVLALVLFAAWSVDHPDDEGPPVLG